MEVPRPHPANGSYYTSADQLDRRIQILEQEIPVFSNKAAEAMVQGVEDNTYRLETERRLEELNRLKEERRRLEVNGRVAQTPPIPNAPPAPGPPAILTPGALVPPKPPVPPPIPRKEQALIQAEHRVKAVSVQDAVFMCAHFLEYDDLIAAACVNKYWRQRVRKTTPWRRLVFSLENTLSGHVGKITAVSTYEIYVVTGSSDGKVKFWEPTKNFQCIKTLNITPSPTSKYMHPRIAELRAHDMHATGADVDDEPAEFPLAVTSLLTVERSVVIGAEDGRLIVWMATTADRKEYELHLHKKAITCMVAGGDECIFTGSADGTVSAVSRKGYPFNPTAAPAWPQPLVGNRRHETGVTAVAVAGGYFFSGSMDGKIIVWAPKTMEFRRILVHNRGPDVNGQPNVSEHKDRITALLGLVDRLYTASWDGTIKLWNARTLECLKDVSIMPIGICWSLGLRRDPSTRQGSLIAGVRDWDIAIIDPETLETLASCEQNHWAYKLERHTHWVKSIVALGDGRIATGSDDWTVKIWQVRGQAGQRQASVFFGLPPGPLEQIDIEVFYTQVSRGKVPYTVEQLQEMKRQQDKMIKEKEATMTPELLQIHQESLRKAAENWAKAREKQKVLKSHGEVTTYNPGTSATNPATVTPGNGPAASTATPSDGENAPVPTSTTGVTIIGPTAVTTLSASVLQATSSNGVNSQVPANSTESIVSQPVDQSTNAATLDTPVVKKEPEENGTHLSLLGQTEASEPTEPVLTEPTPAVESVSAEPGTDVVETQVEKREEKQIESEANDVVAETVADVLVKDDSSSAQLEAEEHIPSNATENGDSTHPDDDNDDGSEEGPEGRVKRRKIAK